MQTKVSLRRKLLAKNWNEVYTIWHKNAFTKKFIISFINVSNIDVKIWKARSQCICHH